MSGSTVGQSSITLYQRTALRILVSKGEYFDDMGYVQTSSPTPVGPAISAFLNTGCLTTARPATTIQDYIRDIPSVATVKGPISVSSGGVAPIAF